MDADAKLIVSWWVGRRDSGYGLAFMDDLRSHLANRVQLTTDGHKAYLDAVALHMMYYNFVRLHAKLRMSPAMAAGVSDRLWEISDIVKLVEDAEAASLPASRGPYRQREISN